MKVQISGLYHQKLEIGHWVISQHGGTFSVAKEVGSTSWSQSFGPLTLMESVHAGTATITASAFGFSEKLLGLAVPGGQPVPFKLELDSGNYVSGSVSLVDETPPAAIG